MWSSELMLTMTGSADGSFAPWVPPLHRLPLQPCANSFLARWCARLMRGTMEGGGQSQIRWFFTRLLLTDQATKIKGKAFSCEEKKNPVRNWHQHKCVRERNTREEGAFLWKFKKPLLRGHEHDARMRGGKSFVSFLLGLLLSSISVCMWVFMW